MGQVSCGHQNATKITVVHEDKGVLFNDSIIEYQCNDCLTNEKPTIFRKDVSYGTITGHEYSSKLCETNNCEHTLFNIDENTIKKCRESTHFSEFAGTITSGFFSGVFDNKFLKAEADCLRCKKRFWVETTYTIEKVWKDYKEIDTMIYGKWNISHKKVVIHTTKSNKEIDYIK